MARKASAYSKKHPFALVPWELLNSRAFRHLPATAGKLLPVFLGKPHVPPQSPQYYFIDFEFTYSEAERLGVSRSTFKTCLVVLVKLGFIDTVNVGGLRGYHLTSSKFRLSDRWITYGTSAFKEVDWNSIAEQQINRQAQFLTATSTKTGPEKKGQMDDKRRN